MKFISTKPITIEPNTEGGYTLEYKDMYKEVMNHELLFIPTYGKYKVTITPNNRGRYTLSRNYTDFIAFFFDNERVLFCCKEVFIELFGRKLWYLVSTQSELQVKINFRRTSI